MSIVLLGSTSGSCTLQEQAVAGTSVLTLPVGTGTVVANNVNSAIVSGTAVASTSGTSIDFTSIPSWVKRITVLLNQVSTNGASVPLVRIGTSSGIEATGYTSGGTYLPSGAGAGYFGSTVGFVIAASNAAGENSGIIQICNISSNTWIYSYAGANPAESGSTVGGGSKTLSGTLDRVRITTTNGTDTFDAGSINILYE
jgi:hypothetical protein